MHLPAPFHFDDRPLIVIWEMTRACALACRHCRAAAMPRRHPGELDAAEGAALIDQIARAAPAVLVLTGGDPMLRRDLAAQVRRAASRGLRVALSPSATPRFLRADLEALREAGVQRLSLSLDGPNRKAHDAFRGVTGTWDWTMRAIGNVRAAGIELQINTTFTRQNVAAFAAMADLVQAVSPVLWSVFQLVPTGRGRMEDLLTAEETERLFERLWELSGRVPFEIKTTEGMHYRRVVAQQSARQGRPARMPAVGVNDGRGFVFVSHTGEVFPSGFLPLSAGNVRNRELLDLYRESPLFRELRDVAALRGKCGRCEFRRLCGGSRARAYAMTGDYLAEDPLCAYQSVRRDPAPAPAGDVCLT